MNATLSEVKLSLPPLRSAGKAILVSVLVAGTLDISDALIFTGLRGTPALVLLKIIASALIGPTARRGGLAMAALGLAMHYCITCAWAALFVVASRRWIVLRRHAVASGLLYGILIYVVMNFLVLPQTWLAGRLHFSMLVFVNDVAALMFCMGLPIALINRRFQPAT